MTTDRDRTDTVLDELNRMRTIAYSMASALAVHKGVSPYVVALEFGLLPQSRGDR